MWTRRSFPSGWTVCGAASVQFRQRSVSVENPTPPAVPRHGELWLSATACGNAIRGAPGSPGASGRGMAISQRAHAAAPSGVGANGSLASPAIRHGGCAESQGAFRSHLGSFRFLARRLRQCGRIRKWWGISPAAIGGGRAGDYAVSLSGRVPVNLNYTLLHQSLASCIGQCGIKKVITSTCSSKKRVSRFRARRSC